VPNTVAAGQVLGEVLLDYCISLNKATKKCTDLCFQQIGNEHIDEQHLFILFFDE
jgi:hypothetical protein